MYLEQGVNEKSFPPLFNKLKHFAMYQLVCGTKFSPKQAIVASLKIGDSSASLLNDQYASGDIPCIEIIFKVSLDPSAGNICKINSCAAQPSDTVSVLQKILDDLKIIITL